jgi:lipopolysaccharide/colanic/teichoic acid biosynthesis glycosyltransferase
MTTPSTDSLKAAPATRPVEIDLAEAPSSAPKITLGQGLPEGMQRVLAAVLLIPAACMLLSIRLIWLVRGVPGPFFFRQDRVGRDGVTFRILKIRTMTDQSGPVFAGVEDTRVIPAGQFLRRSHLDELPQLWNVFRGDMLLVGPRPEQPGPYALLSKLLVGYDSRVIMKPGMVALSNLRDGYARSIPEHRRRVVWDRWYIRNRSISTDLILLVQGVLRPFRLR